MFNNKLVVRAGWGMYYDRGELYSYLSPGGRPEHRTGRSVWDQSATALCEHQFCPTPFPGIFQSLQLDAFESLGRDTAPPPNGNPSTIIPPTMVDGNSVVRRFRMPRSFRTAIIPFYLAVYARNNKLPYTMNSTLDIQWQPRNDLAIDIGYVNALGRHEIIPIPFNQARIATPTNPLCGPAAVCPNPAGRLLPSPTLMDTQYRRPAGCGLSTVAL